MTTPLKRKYKDRTRDAKGKPFRSKHFMCEYIGCEKTFGESEKLLAHIRVRHTMERPFGCDVCHKTFPTERCLREHKKIHTEDNRQFRCSWVGCDSAFRTKQILVDHIKSHEQLREYGCDECDLRFNNKKDLHKHKVRHSDARPYVCDWPACEAAYKDLSQIMRHKETHLAVKKYVCDREGCGKGFVTKKYLYQHKRQHTLPFVCSWPACDRRYGSKDKLTDHMNSHQGLRVVECPVEGCDKTFTSKPCARQHLRQSFNTTLDGQLNSENNHLIQRLTQESHPRSGAKKTRKLKDNNPKTTTTTPKRRYNKQKKTISEEFNTDSDHNWDTISAMKREVVDNTDETMINSKPEKCGGSDGTTRYRCHWEGCDKSFTQKPNLVGHIRSTHTKERPFRCEECGKRFTTETILKLHDRTHQSVKRYKCGHNGCAFETNTPNTLKCHRLRHSTAPAPYRCQIDGCGREFFYRHVMVRHQRSKAHNPEAEARALALKYACEWPGCGKRVHSRDVLVAHVRLRHTNEKPFKCDE
ncbi:unnamed protein product, partial [Medioppia subpectinata]